jgi:PIN domain nuclease of toxin-antitoxin system
MPWLLDTHALLWFSWGDAQLSLAARALIEDETNQILVSVASIWEIAIKIGAGKLALTEPLDQFVNEHLDGNQIDLLPIERRHAIHVATLPLHHRDPFDRILVAQSQLDGMPLVSADPIFDVYGVTRLW